MSNDLTDILNDAYDTNERNGYNEYAEERAKSTKAGNKHLGNKGLLVVSEITEAQDELRKGHEPFEIYFKPSGKPEGYLVELADALIRIVGDAAEVFAVHAEELEGTNFAEIVRMKMAYNARREDTVVSGVKAF